MDTPPPDRPTAARPSATARAHDRVRVPAARVLAALALALLSPAMAGSWRAEAAPASPVSPAAPAGVLVTAPRPDAAMPGTVIAIGGALRYDNAAVWSRIVALAGGRGARFVVLATAAGDPAGSAARSIAALEAQGAVAEHLPVAPRLAGTDVTQAVRDPALLARVRAAQGVYLTGGAQERIVDALQPGGEPTPLLEAIRELLGRGGVVAGTSAGAAVMSAIMFRDATDVVAVMRGALEDGREVDRGLGFAGPALFVDQHFLRRGRLGRMLPLMLARGYRLGVGVEEDSAVVMRDGTLEVVGAGGALFVDLGAAAGDPAVGAFSVTGARLSFLGDGDRLDLRSGWLVPSELRLRGQRIEPGARGFQPYFEDSPFLLDVLADGAVLRALTHVLDGPSAEVRGLAFDARPESAEPRDLGFEFRFHRGPDTVGWFTSGLGGEAYTVANVRLDVRPVRVAQPLYTPWPARGAQARPAAAP
jgi:cyanophycinase